MRSNGSIDEADLGRGLYTGTDVERQSNPAVQIWHVLSGKCLKRSKAVNIEDGLRSRPRHGKQLEYANRCAIILISLQRNLHGIWG